VNRRIPNLSGVLVLGCNLQPLGSDTLDEARRALDQFAALLSASGRNGRIPMQTGTSSSSFSRETVGSTTTHTVSSTFIGGDVFFPKQINFQVSLALPDDEIRKDRSSPKKASSGVQRTSLLPHWTHNLVHFVRAAVNQARACDRPLSPQHVEEARDYALDAWLRQGMPDNAELISLLPTPVTAGLVDLVLPMKSMIHRPHPVTSRLPQALCLRPIGAHSLAITPLEVKASTDLDAIDKMRLIARRRLPEKD